MFALENVYIHYFRETTQNLYTYVKTLSTYYLGFRKAAIIYCLRAKALSKNVILAKAEPNQSISFGHYLVSTFLIVMNYRINFREYINKSTGHNLLQRK